MTFSVACAQIAPKKADVQANLDTIAEAILQASGEGVDLVVFPEGATTGYFLEGGVLESSLASSELFDQLSGRLSKLERPIDVVVGFYQKADGTLYNASAYIEFGTANPRLVHVYHKFFLPTYGVFDEERFVARGRELGVFDSRLGRIGLLVCEDVWHSVLPTVTAMAGAQVLIVPAASPGRGFQGDTASNLERYRRLLQAIAEEHGLWCVNCQLCGFEGGKGFVGGSAIFDPAGRIVASSPILDPHLLVAELDLGLIELARSQSPLIADLRGVWSDVKRLIAGIE